MNARLTTIIALVLIIGAVLRGVLVWDQSLTQWLRTGMAMIRQMDTCQNFGVCL